MKISISGIRGIYGHDDLNLYEITKFSRLFAVYLIKAGGKCVIGRDTRPSSRIIAQTVTAALMQEGVDVFDLNVAPTPFVFRESRKYGAGYMVTASHNPLEWNGLKLAVGGRLIFENELNLMLKGTLPTEKILNKFGKSFDAVSDYVNELVDLVGTSESTKHIKIGLDPGGGATSGYANQLFKNLGHKFYSINDVYGMSSRGPDPTIENLNDLSALVMTNQLDFGFAFDLDGDRLVIVNNRGEKLTPDLTLLICVAGALNLGMKKFVTSIDTSLAVEKFARYYYGKGMLKFDYSKVGEANVVSKMLEVNADAGGEGSSAGFVMPKFNMCRDGFLASAIISSLDIKTINDCINFASQYSQIRTKIPMHYDLHKEVIDKLSELLKKESSQILTLDGIKAIIDDDSWILVRSSNTEDAIRISVESKASNVQKLYNKISNKVQSTYDKVK
jgi:phosphomannomutase